MRRTWARRLALLSCVAGLGACGSSGSGDGFDLFDTTSESEVFDGVPERDGYVTTQMQVSTTDFGVQAGDGGILYLSVHGFLSFDHSTIPDGATILSATLFANQVGVISSPYTDLGALLVDHVDIGADLDPTDYDAPPLTAGIGALSTSPDLGSRWLDVTEAVQADVDAGRVTSDFRLAFGIEDDNDLSNDMVTFTDADDSDATGVVPALAVTWRR